MGSVLKIHFFIELSLKMIQFKTKSQIFIKKIFSPEYPFTKKEENDSKFQNKTQMWLQSPPEAPVWVIDPLKWTEICPTNALASH